MGNKRNDQHMAKLLSHVSLVCSLLATFVTMSTANNNPMWRSGYDWVCIQGGSMICERGDVCTFGSAPTLPVRILFENSVVEIGNQKIGIKRHYSQQIDGSPLTDEVHIELSNNSVIWLTPSDASRTWSDIWSGMYVEPKRGAVLSVSHPLFCSPKR